MTEWNWCKVLSDYILSKDEQDQVQVGSWSIWAGRGNRRDSGPLILRRTGDPRSSMHHNVWRVIDHVLTTFKKERMQMEEEEKQAEETVAA